MKRKVTMFVMAVFLCAGSYAYAGPPSSKQSQERQRPQQEMERESLKHRQEMDRGEYGKHLEFGYHDGKGRQNERKHRYFTSDHRVYIQDHYVNRYHKGHCPPGLAKKKNGCIPPGQVKKWKIGRPLPRNVVFYDLPKDVRDHFGPPPPRHRFVRVAQDILLIAVGSDMVIDAIDDLNWEFNR
jgi:hypothetical protein